MAPLVTDLMRTGREWLKICIGINLAIKHFYKYYHATIDALMGLQSGMSSLVDVLDGFF